MRTCTALATLLFAFGLAAGAAAESVTIDHRGVGCLVAEQYPRLVACFKPAGALARARIQFRAQGGSFWYAVDMKSDLPCYYGVLPKPRKTTTRIEYYIEATDRAFGTSKTQELQPAVV